MGDQVSSVVPLTLGQPAALLLLLGLPWLVWLSRRRRRALGPRRGAAATAVRLLVFGLGALALAEPRLVLPDDRMSVAFVVDASRSVPPDQQAAATAWVQQALATARPDDQVALIAFGATPRLVHIGEALTVPDRDGSDVAAALRLAGDLAPNIVLLSDGWDTSGHAADQVGWLQGHGAHVSYFPLNAPTRGAEVAVQRLDAPAYVRVGEPAEVRLTLASTVSTRARVSLAVDDRPDLSEEVSLEPGTRTIGLRYTPDSVAPHVLSATLAVADDTLSDNNRLDTLVVARPAGRVLLVEQQPGQADAVATLLAGAGLAVQHSGPDAIPARAADLTAYDAVALADVQATRLSLDQQQTLQAYVREAGHGLVVFGGPNSYGLGGYADTTLEQALPVSATPPNREEQGDLALVLVIDTSGSMGLASNHASKIGMAREAAIRASDILKPADSIGVLGFNTRDDWIVPLQRVADNGGLAAIQARIGTLQAAGGTDVYAALQAAFATIGQVNARYRHVLLLTDGHSPNPDYASLVQAAQAQGITLSTIGIGGDADAPLLSQLAQIGQGRHYLSERFEDIPSIVTRETTIATRSALAEGTFQPSPSDPSPLLEGLEASPPPSLTGYVQTKPRPGATQALLSSRGDPILAHWHYGLGRVVAWTSDVSGRWAGDWLAWPGAAEFFSRLVRWTMAEPVDARLRVSADVVGRQVTLRADRVDETGAFADGLDTRATVVTPDGRGMEVRLPQTGPGHYEQPLQVDQPGIYRVIVGAQMAGFAVDGAEETRMLGANTSLLDWLASQTGGQRLDTPDQALARHGHPAAQTRELPLWPWLVAAALSLWPLDIALRRLRPPLRRHWVV